MNISPQSNESQIDDPPEQQGRSNKHLSLHRLAKLARTAVLLATGAVIGGAGGCSDQPNQPNDENESAEISTGVVVPKKQDISETPPPLIDQCENPDKLKIVDLFQCLGQGFYDPDHPQAVRRIPLEDVPRYLKQRDDAKKEVNRLQQQRNILKKKIQAFGKHRKRTSAETQKLKQLQEELKVQRQLLKNKRNELWAFNRALGKIGIFNEETAFSHIAVADFTEDLMKTACKKAGMTDEECLLYHVVLFENSGSLWAEANRQYPEKGAVGPAQIIPQWFEWQKNLRDGITTENFFKLSDKQGQVDFDGRYDPAANLEMGARILKYFLKLFGANHPDFAIFAYNQGENDAFDFIKAWAQKHKGVSAVSIAQRRGADNSKKPLYAYFLDYLDTPLSEMLFDDELARRFMRSDNGGRGYVSKVLAMRDIAKDTKTHGFKQRAVEIAPVRTDESGTVQYKWDNLYIARELPTGESLNQFAQHYGFNFERLAFANRQIRNTNAKFKIPVRIWIPHANFPDSIRDTISRTVGRSGYRR